MPEHMLDGEILKMKFEAVTPLWPGGPLGAATYKCFGNTCIGPFLPDAKQLIGRVRWLLRTVEASVRLLEGKPVRAYREVDSLASGIFGSTHRSSKVIVRLKYSLPSQANLDYFDPRLLKSPPPQGINILDVMEIEGYRLLREGLGLKVPPQLSRKDRERYIKARPWLAMHREEFEGLYLLTAIPRVRLAFQGASDIYSIYSMAPLRPEPNLEVEILRRRGSDLSKAEAKLLALAIPYTMAFIGLGKATTRGFGRFKLGESEAGLQGVDGGVGDCLDKLASLTPGNLKEVFVECGCAMINTAAEILGSGVSCDAETLGKYTLNVEDDKAVVVQGGIDVLGRLRVLRVPTLVTALALADKYFVESVRHPCPYATRELARQSLPGCIAKKREVKDILAALSAVGKATLKLTWKLAHEPYGVNARTPGPGYHTWALGFPRLASKSKTGYYSIGSARVGEYCSSRPPNVGELRRLSPAIVTVLCSDGSCAALLEAFISVADFEEKLDGIAHVGQHNQKKIKNKQIYHVASIKYIASTKTLGKAHGCPRDKAGIATPKRALATLASSSVALASQLVALEWVKTLLS